MTLIASATEPVPLRGDALDEVWWQGRQWAMTSFGLERRDGTYPIEADRLYERPYHDGYLAWCWPLHMAGKCWIDIHDFCTAFAVALALHPRLARRSRSGAATCAGPASTRSRRSSATAWLLKRVALSGRHVPGSIN